MYRLLPLLLLALTLFATPVFAQTNPCTGGTAPAFTVVSSNNSAVVAQWPNYNSTFNGQPVWTDTDVRIFAKGDNPATAIQVAGVAVPKAQWLLVAGTTDCYRTTAPGTIVFGVQPNVEYDLYVRAKGTEVGAWSAPVPFGRTGPPAAPSAVRIIP